MEKNVDNFYGIGLKFKKQIIDSRTEVVKYPGWTMSRNPMYSAGYCDCNGLVLMNHNLAALSHYYLNGEKNWTGARTKEPEDYVEEMISEVSRFMDRSEIISVLIAGQEEHFKRIKEVLKKQEIPILGEYVDGWRGDDDMEDFEIKNVGEKEVLVIPETREVIMHSPPVGYLKLL